MAKQTDKLKGRILEEENYTLYSYISMVFVNTYITESIGQATILKRDQN